MEKQRKIILEPNGYYGGFRTTSENRIIVDNKLYAVALKENGYIVNDETSFDNAEEAFKYIILNDLEIENVETIEDRNFGILHIKCTKRETNDEE